MDFAPAQSNMNCFGTDQNIASRFMSGQPDYAQQASQDVNQEIPRHDDNQAPSQADLNLMKEKIMKLMRMENLADITLAGYMIKLLRNRTKMSFRELHEEVSKCYDTLRRSDGSKYTGDLAKALKGCLTSSEIFKEAGDNQWIIREKEAKMYEDKTTKKLKTLINKKKGRSGRKKESDADGEAESEDDVSGSEEGSDDSMDIEPLPVKKVKTAAVQYEKTTSLMENMQKIFRNEGNATTNCFNLIEEVKTDDGLETLKQKMSKEKLEGIIECFEFFHPLIQNALKQSQKGETGASQKGNGSTKASKAKK